MWNTGTFIIVIIYLYYLLSFCTSNDYFCFSVCWVLWDIIVDMFTVESQKDYHGRRKHHQLRTTTMKTTTIVVSSPVSTTATTTAELEDNRTPKVTAWSTAEPAETWEITTTTSTTVSSTTISSTPSTTTTTTQAPRESLNAFIIISSLPNQCQLIDFCWVKSKFQIVRF